MSNPYLDRTIKRGEAGRRNEKRQAKALGLRVQPGSGAVAGAKGDIRHDQAGLLIENKSTVNSSFSIELGHLIKVTHEAMDQNLAPALAINFTNGQGAPVRDGEWLVIPIYWAKLKGLV